MKPNHLLARPVICLAHSFAQTTEVVSLDYPQLQTPVTSKQ